MSYNILSLDGGGSWAILQAMALKEIYKGKSTKEILGEFDMVAANSGGSLMLACMIEFDTMDQVIEMFLLEENRRDVFSELGFFEKSIFEEIAVLLKSGPQYKAERKLEGIEKALPKYGKQLFTGLSEKLGLTTKFLVVAYDYDLQRAVYFSSDPKHFNGNIYENTLAQTVHASSNAPIKYFDEPAVFKYKGDLHRYWDGAMGGNNNPALVAVVEAMGVYQQKAEDIRVLSLGTGNVILPIEGFTKFTSDFDFLIAEKEEQSLKKDIVKMSNCILSEPMDAATYMSHIVLGGGLMSDNLSNIVRLNPLIQPFLHANKWVLPSDFDEDKFKVLIDLEMDAVKQDEVKLIVELGEKWIANKIINQAIRCDSENLQPVLGHSTFASAANYWKQISIKP